MVTAVCVLSPLSCPTLCDTVHCSPPGCSAHWILQARVLVWIAMPSSSDLPDPEIKLTSLTSSSLAGRFFTTLLAYKGHSFSVGLATTGIQHDWNRSDSCGIIISLHIKDKWDLSNSHLSIQTYVRNSFSLMPDPEMSLYPWRTNMFANIIIIRSDGKEKKKLTSWLQKIKSIYINIWGIKLLCFFKLVY